MTERIVLRSEKQKKLSWSFLKRCCLGYAAVFMLLLFFKCPTETAQWVESSLSVCAKRLIPSLFPFMVIAEVIVSSGLGAALVRPLASVLKPILRLPEIGCCAVIMGMLCGFPIGARCAVSALKANRLSREEAQRVLLFSINPSTAFLISAVGVSLWGSKRFGVSLCITVLLSQWIVGLLFTHAFRTGGNDQNLLNESKAAEHAYPNAPRLFTQAISSSCLGMLQICAYVTFFSALCGTVNLVLDQFATDAVWKALVACVLELSGGVSAANGLAHPLAAASFCAFACGWSGVSVHCQLLSICDGYGLQMRSYFAAKLLQGALCAILFFCWIRLDPTLLIPANPC